MLSAFLVTNTDDSGPGSLRQAILDSDAATGGTNTIDFAIPGQGVRTIALQSSLPALTTGALIDGTSQPDYAGSPLIALDLTSSGSPDGLTVTGSEVTVSGIASTGVAFSGGRTEVLVVRSDPLRSTTGGDAAPLRIDVDTDERLVARVHPEGLSTRLSLLDSRGDVLVQSDGLSPGDQDGVIDQHLPAGTYFLRIENMAGAGTYTLTTTLTSTNDPFQPIIGAGHPYGIAAGDFNGDGRTDLAAADPFFNDVAVLLGKGDGSFIDPSELALALHATPLVADVISDGAADALMIDPRGAILYRQGRPEQPGTFDPPVAINPVDPATGAIEYPSLDLAWVSISDQGPMLASADATGAAVSLFAWRDGHFTRVGSLATGLLPAQIVSADVNGDGWDGLIVRNAGDGTLSIFFNDGPGASPTDPVPFGPPITLAVGPAVSDVSVARVDGDAFGDLLLTTKLAGEVGVLRSLGEGIFAPLAWYRAGAGPYGLTNADDRASVTSLEATAGVAAGQFSPGGAISLVTIDPGSNTLGLLAGLGPGRFANPAAMLTKSPGRVVRVADLDGDFVLDLAVLSADGIDVYLSDGHGGLSPPAHYDAGPDPTGLTVADANEDGRPDLLVGDSYGDLLVLLGKGDGTFAPYHKADQAVALAVADLASDGQPDFIYADQGLDRVTVQYAGDQPKALGDRSDGILSPGAVKLADLNGDGIPDLVVANSGSNNILVYPGTGDGQFGPALNGGHGFFTGTNPTGFTIADLNDDGLPDLLVANTGSNDVSVLLGQGRGSSWTLTPGPRIKTDGGPSAVVVGNILNDGHPDLAVANQQANNVQVFPGVGGGFFNDRPQAVKTYAVGQAPSGLFLGRFSGSGTGIAALNAGSNTVTLIGPTGVEQSVPTGGQGPTTGFAGDFTGNGFTDLVVGNSADGHLALLMGGAGGLSLSQTITSPAVPEPTGLSFAGVSDGLLSFYASTAGREVATALAFDLNPQETGSGTPSGSGPGLETPPGIVPGAELATGPVASAGAVLASATAGAFQQVAQLLSANGSTLSLVAPLFTVTILPGEFEAGATSEGGVLLLANFLPGTGPGGAGQGLRGDDDGPPAEAADEPGPAEEKAATVVTAPPTLPPWEQVAMGLKRAWEQVRSEVLERAGLADGDGGRPIAAPDRRSKPAPAAMRPPDRPHPRPPSPERAGPDAPDGPSAAASPPGESTDTALAELAGPTVAAPREGPGWWDAVIAAGRGRLVPPIATAAALASAGAAAWAIHAARKGRGGARGPSRHLASTN